MGSTALLLLLLAAALLSCGTAQSGCGVRNQACSPGQASRHERDIVFPGDPESEDIEPLTRYLTREQIDRLNELQTVEQVVSTFSNHGIDDNVEPPILSARILPQLSSRIGGRDQPGEARSPRIKKAVPAKCQPTLQPVALGMPDDLTVMYWPKCVLLERCGGCCFNDRTLSCQPTRTEQVPFEVSRLLINGMKENGTEILHLERHVNCKCSCIVKAEHCNSQQEYSPNECRCNCGNSDERRKCLSEANKLWDNNKCECKCRHFPAEGCTTGLDWDPHACMCTVIRRHYQSDNTYKLEKRRRRWQNRTSNPLSSPIP